jgi:hypothetical protein
MRLELSDREQELLVRLLEAARGDSNTGIHHAMDYQTRDSLRAERALIQNLLDRLLVAPMAGPR